MIRVLCWYWRQPGGRTRYEPWHVNVWRDMVARNLSMPHRIACVTDTPEGLDPRIEIIAPPRDFELVRIPTWKEHRPQCLRRIAMFAPDAGTIFGERFVCMDIDCVVAGPLDPLFEGGEDFRMFRGTSAGRLYNGSMMMLRAGARPQVYTDFTPEGAALAGQRFIGSDQAWITHSLGPGEATWGPEHGVVWHGSRRNGARLLFFPGREKPWERPGMPEVAEHYCRDPQPGYCLILGRGGTVWQEAEAALAEGQPAAVIAMGEAAQHWPRKVDAVASHEAHACEIAAMMGFSDVRLCGATGKVPRQAPYSERLQRRRAQRARRLARA